MPLKGQAIFQSKAARPPAAKNLPLLDNYEWQQHGACVGLDTNIFFPESSLRGKAKAEAAAKAKAYCKTCNVREQCLQFSLDMEEPYGIYGGLTEEERLVVLRRTKVKRGIS